MTDRVAAFLQKKDLRMYEVGISSCDKLKKTGVKSAWLKINHDQIYGG